MACLVAPPLSQAMLCLGLSPCLVQGSVVCSHCIAGGEDGGLCFGWHYSVSVHSAMRGEYFASRSFCVGSVRHWQWVVLEVSVDVELACVA